MKRSVVSKGTVLNNYHWAYLKQPTHLTILFRVSSAELVHVVEVVRRDDEAVELAQVTLACLQPAVHAVVVNSGLTPHTSEGGSKEHTHIKNTQKAAQTPQC